MIFIDSFTANLLQSVMVKEFENRLAFRRVTGKNKVAPFFPDTVYLFQMGSTFAHSCMSRELQKINAHQVTIFA